MSKELNDILNFQPKGTMMTIECLREENAKLLKENAHLKKRLDPVTSNYSRQTGDFPEGYSQEAMQLAERLAVASGDTEDYWGEWYNKAVAKLTIQRQAHRAIAR